MNGTQAVEILIVEDNAGHSELLRRNLRRNGVNNATISVDNGLAALDYVYRRGPYAGRPSHELLILLDINMPGAVNGMGVLQQVKGDPAKKHIPVIMLTTTDDPAVVERCYALGCNVYVTKPVDPNAFIEAIRKLGLFVSIVNVPKEGGEAP